MRSAHLWILLAALSGCTAAKASLQLVNAEQALTRAESQGARERAAYEYTMAELYLGKAAEEAGYSEYRVADALARQSAEWSDRAVIFLEERGRSSIQLDELPDGLTPPPPPTEAPDVPPPAAPTEDWLETSSDTPIPGAPAPPEPSAEPEPEPKDEFEIEEEDDDIEVQPQ
jgi:hypothetical protein